MLLAAATNCLLFKGGATDRKKYVAYLSPPGDLIDTYWGITDKYNS